MAAKLNTRARAAPAGVVVGLLLATCLLLAATAADASRPLKVPSSSAEAQHTVESPPVVGYIQTVVVGAAEQDGGGGGAPGYSSRLVNLSVGMLAGIKNSGPSPGDGH